MINQLIKSILGIFFFIFPIFFLTITSESYEYNKMALLLVTCAILFFLYSLKIIKDKKIVYHGSSFTTPLFFITGIYIISTLIQSPNIVVTLTTPLSTTSIIAGFLFYMILTQTINNSDKENFLGLTIIGGILVSLAAVASYTGFVPKSLYTTSGTLVATSVFLSIVSVYCTSRLIAKIIDDPENAVFGGRDLFYAISLFVTLGTLVLIIIHLFSDQKPILLPLGFGWMILMEILKNAKTMLLGVGPSNYITAFTIAKPAIFNSSPVWNIIFTSSSSFFLTLATETGMLSAFFYLVILIKSIKLIHTNQQITNNKQQTTYPFNIALIFALIIQLLIPSGMTAFILTIILLAFASSQKVILETDLSRLNNASYFLLLPSIIFFGLVLYFGGRAYLSEMYFKQSLDAIVNNRGTDAYNLGFKAIALNPRLDRYHLAMSQLSLALANGISSKPTITEEDKQNIPKLIQQSIDQGRLAVALYRTNVANWDNLARTYASITNYAKDSDLWAISSYQQRLALDPYSPSARLALGGFYLYLNRFQDAENIFREAVSLKPDFPNTHFNLGFTLRQEKKYAESYQALQTALALVAPDSLDAKKIAEELKLIPSQYATTSAEILNEGITGLPAQAGQTLESAESSPPAILKAIPSLVPTINLQSSQ